MASDHIDLVYHVLDLQLLDVNGTRCGKVDDIEFESGPMRAVAILSGSGLYPRRLPGRRLPALARHLVGEEVIGKNVIRVPWDEIDSIGATVVLKGEAEHYGLGRGDRAVAPVISRLLLVPERKR